MSTLTAKHLLTVSNVEFMTAMPRGARLLLPEISWADYEYLLGEIKDGSPLRLHYDQGKLEIMTLSPQHESLKVLFGHVVFVLAEELAMKLIGLGSTTFKLPEAARGTEPDDCFYIRRADAIEGKSSLDLRIDPGPDLVVEIDLTHPSLNKMPIYASLDVTEVWRYDGEQMHLYLLTQGQYKEIVNSDLFPFLTAAKLTDFLAESNFRNVIPAIRAFRKWVNSQLA
jgi:Uma2 family endonuclease